RSALTLAGNDLARCQLANTRVRPRLHRSGYSLIDSVPPATTAVAAPGAVLYQACPMASIPEAQFRCTGKAGAGRGTPAASETTRPMLGAPAGVPQLPSTPSSTRAASNSVRARSSDTATRPSSAAETVARGPPDFAKGVRTPFTMTTRFSP